MGMGEFDDFQATFFEECAELIGELEEDFAAIAAGDLSAGRLNAVFRAIHSIKGGAGAFGFARLVGFTHDYETLLDEVRGGRRALDGAAIALCIRANDVVADLVSAAREGREAAGGLGLAEQEGFRALLAGEAVAAPGPTFAETPDDDAAIEDFDIDFVPVRVDLDSRRDAGGDESGFDGDRFDSFEDQPLRLERTQFEIRFAPHGELYARANDPLILFRELASLGETRVKAVLEEIPPLSDFEPFGVYASWEITLVSATASEASIAEVFEFVEGICDLEIVRLGDAPAPEIAATPMRPAAGPSLADLAEAMMADAMIADAAADLLFDETSPTVLAPAPAAPQPVTASEAESERRPPVHSIRVDLDKIDRVVNMVGELVITQSMLTQQMDETLRSRYQELVRGLEVLAQTTRGLQDSVMAIRAQPVKSVFSRMPRLVRDLCARTGKLIRLETFGEATEIDKTIVEQIADPLTHMIRNSADHGIESPDARRAAGKPEHGTIRLSAEQAGGNILIIVEDDGAGIDRERVLAVARARGLVGPDQVLSDEQIDNLVFAPGFSTAETISDISGRGVGMDVVRTNIDKIGGSVDVRSRPGQGTRVALRLPLTLAVLDVMLVRLGASPYVIPLSGIVETMQCARSEFGNGPSGAPLLRVRGDYVQVIDMGEVFGQPSRLSMDDRFIVLCETDQGSRVALLVDDIVGQQQVVIKSLEANFERVEGIAGGTILGDGSVGLIVDVEGLRGLAGRRLAA
jgi:two-component system chemotaxis sensor kinase CheA